MAIIPQFGDNPLESCPVEIGDRDRAAGPQSNAIEGKGDDHGGSGRSAVIPSLARAITPFMAMTFAKLQNLTLRLAWVIATDISIRH
ncbi:MAG: hypothetical protein Fur0042_30960 [Cyanophyceae cyanobacterium]